MLPVDYLLQVGPKFAGGPVIAAMANVASMASCSAFEA
jgi:hypothetical protein